MGRSQDWRTVAFGPCFGRRGRIFSTNTASQQKASVGWWQTPTSYVWLCCRVDNRLWTLPIGACGTCCRRSIMKRTLEAALLLILSPASSYRASQAFTRRKIVAATSLFSSSGLVNQVAAAGTPTPNDWGLYPEGRPYTRYIDNAGKVASHLAWYVDGDESSAIASARLQAELAQFASTYQPALRPEGSDSMPGLMELKSASDALAEFLPRDGGVAVGVLPASVADAVRRNARTAKKLLRRASAASIWPTCRGLPLGTRDTVCAPE